MQQGLGNTQENVNYLNIREGKIIQKNAKGTYDSYTTIVGRITKVSFNIEEFKGKKFEKAKIYINAIGELFCLQMRTDSGYFRGLCNCLRNAKTNEAVGIYPNLKEIDKKTTTTCFVKQNDVWLKHFFTKENMGDFPELKRIEYKDQIIYDNQEQIDYWKNWLINTFNNVTSESQIIEADIDLPDDMPF